MPASPTRRTAVAALATAGAAAGAVAAPTLPATPAGQPQDFDFEHGSWRTSLRRRLRPLSGSDLWAEYSGTSLVRPILGGRANLVELDVAGPEGRIQGLSLRLFEVQNRRWTLNFSNAASGTLAAPMVGGFGGSPRGLFYGAEDFNGRPILVRFVIESLSPERRHFEQAFSADGGKTWELNWVAVDTRA
ncbi:hypothetical protein J2X20_001028 [Pelomonas saccharophila]|uniref:DUF1579 domain-containing protein n=1 Tax=Roseateles saccharophilus TaxID=304 RepID=A0ABU1YHS0_ROSSA|nr:DUF1579 domain-containing protein [Roseateles saccharophilus]MDR7268399.1 hypothetical protein [Roseateles saccharophilus]